MIRKTRLGDGYGIYRAYPRKPDGWLIEPAQRAVAKPMLPTGIFWLLGLCAAGFLVLIGIVLLLWLGRNRAS